MMRFILICLANGRETFKLSWSQFSYKKPSQFLICRIIFLIIMPQKKKRITCDSKRQYARISLKKRKMLVRMVEHQGLTITASVKKLKIKLSTARLILQKYRKTGTFPMRKFKKVGKMLLDLPDEAKKEYNQPLIKQQNRDDPIIKEQFWNNASYDSVSNEEELSENSCYDVKRQE